MSRRTLLAFAFALAWLPALGAADGDDYDEYTIRPADIPKDAPVLIGMPENRPESRGISYFVWENDGLRKIRFVAKAFGLSCIEPQRVSCGCSIRVVGIGCRSSNYRQTHFFSELHQGAPLWMNYSGREFSMPSVKPVEQVFYRSKGDSWSEEYRAGDMTVIIRYRPAASTCPADKGADGCEYFDVAAEIVLKANDKSHKYSGHGSCGC